VPSLSHLLDDDEVLRLGDLPMVPFAEGLLDRFPKSSSADICDTWHDFHPLPEPPVAKAEFKRVRDAWKDRRTSVASATEESSEKAQQASNAREQAWAQLEVAIASGNGKKQAELIKVIKGLDDLAPERASASGTENWDLLEEPERACLLALVAKVNGQPLDEDGEWFVALLARVPERYYEVHPAHVPLPEAGRPAMLTP
jgi:hypothetical protein